MTLKNWIPELDLMCRKDFIIGLFGSLYFARFTLGAVLLTPLADRYGRKTIVLVSNTITLSGYLILVLVHNLYARYIGLFILGLSASPRCGNSYILLLESVQ